jgi:hypothetical protein
MAFKLSIIPAKIASVDSLVRHANHFIVIVTTPTRVVSSSHAKGVIGRSAEGGLAYGG